MVSSAFPTCGAIEIVFVENKMNSVLYQIMLAASLLPVASLITSGDWRFQQDIASGYVLCTTKSWMKPKKVKPFQWPTPSPALNPSENLWGIMVRNVYKNGRQYINKSDLKNTIKNFWSKIDLSGSRNRLLIQLTENYVPT
ncbi:Transposable element Tc3 transposase [Araneus ventricosus]|uniref:Transposable element Tc3 transposase n=1 Tax=Araneus ventricosus TaxID=182803 RepID=A0A4Y2D7I0_ARAVE|nr:Transposable element Tc3 transposase [Araneus ventricosus]